MARKRISKKTRDVIQSLIFFTSTMAIISCLIMYLWVYTEIDETLLAIEIQNSTAKELQNGIHELNRQIESMSRADVIAKKAQDELRWYLLSRRRSGLRLHPGKIKYCDKNLSKIQNTNYGTGRLYIGVLGRSMRPVISGPGTQW